MADAKYATLSQKSKTILLTDLLSAAFGMDTIGGVLRLGRTPSVEDIRGLAETVMHLWPKDWRSAPVVHDDGFNVLLWADQTPNMVASAITRNSLHADRIFICNPFTDIMLYHPQQSPAVIPEAWTYEYALNALFMSLARPWVEADLVELVQNPLSFDVNLFDVFRDAMDKCFAEHPALFQITDDAIKNSSLIIELLWQVPRSKWADFVSRLPLSPLQQQQILSEAARRAAIDPLRAAIPEMVQAKGLHQILKYGTGLSYAQAIAIAAYRHAQIVAHDGQEARMLELDGQQLTGAFQQAAHSLSQMQLSFLNNVTADFALGLRKDGRLREFRQYISSLTRGIQFRNSEKEYSEAATREFADRFEGEYHRYREDWTDIQRKLAAGTAAAVVGAVATGTAACLTGNLALTGVLGAAASAAMSAVINACFDRRKLDRQPLGIVLRLETSQVT